MNCINAAIKEWGIQNVLKRMMVLSHYHEIIEQDMQSLFKSMNKSERKKNMDLLTGDDSFGFLDSDDDDEPLSDEDDTSVYGFKQNNSVKLSANRSSNSSSISSSSRGVRGGRRGYQRDQGDQGDRSGRHESDNGNRSNRGNRGSRGNRGNRGTRGTRSRNRRESYSTTSLEYSEDTVTLSIDEFSEMRDEMNRLKEMYLTSLKALDKFEKKLKK